MPEVWLGYGRVEVAVEIKRDRLGQIFEDSLPGTDIEQCAKALESLKELETVNMIAGDAEVSTSKFIIDLADSLAPTKINLHSTDELLKQLKRELQDKPITYTRVEKEQYSVGVVDGIDLKLPLIFSRKDLYLVSTVGYHPLFGFSGGPVSLLTLTGGNMTLEAIKRESELKPSPGKETSAGWFANRVAEELGELKAIEALPGKNGFSRIYVDSVVNAHKKSCADLLEHSMRKIGGKVLLAVSSPGEEEKCRTLNSALNSLWNILPALDVEASVVIFAEAKDGLGSEALLKYVYSGLDVKGKIKKGEYVNGLENLFYLLNYGSKYDLGFLTTLPKTFIEKRFGFKSFPTGNAAVNYLISKSEDRKRKVTVLKRGDKTLLSEG